MSAAFSPAPPPPPVSHARRTRWLLAVLALLVLVVLAGTIVAVRWNAIGQAIAPSCAIGVTGTAASVTVQGWGADSACHSMLGTGTYQLRSGPQGVIVCQYAIQGDLVTVRDEGLLKLVGAAICASLRQRYPSAT